MTQTVEQAIVDSIRQNRIVTIEAEAADIEVLKLEADDYVDNGPVTEFWGRDEDGDDWRVHVAR